EKIERHEAAPRPDLPKPVVDALEFEEPESDATDMERNDLHDASVDAAQLRRMTDSTSETDGQLPYSSMKPRLERMRPAVQCTTDAQSVKTAKNRVSRRVPQLSRTR